MRGRSGSDPGPVTLPRDVRERVGSRDGAGRRFAVIASRFHRAVTTRLVRGAVDALIRNGVAPADIEVIYVPGAFELPAACQRVMEGTGFAGIVALGCVIRGETPHFDYVAGTAARELGALSVAATIPVAFGVLTTENLEQALDRSGPGEDNKGFESALSVLEMANLFRDFELQ